jgi:phage terminase small subunit
MLLALSAAARKIWHATVPILMQVPGLLTVADGSVLAGLCEVQVEKDQVLRAARAASARALRQAKSTGAAASKEEVRAAVIEKYSDSLNRLRHRENVLRRELGLSPSARSSIRISGAPGCTRTDPLDKAFFTRTRLVAV